jgi:hypothetical protein
VCPANARYHPHYDVRVALATARERGVPFDEVWPAALAGATFPMYSSDRIAWEVAFASTEGEWRAAYEREPSRRGAAVSALLAVIDEERMALAGVAS